MPFEEPAGHERGSAERITLSDADISRAFQTGYDIRQAYIEQLAELQSAYAEAANLDYQSERLKELQEAKQAFAEQYVTYESLLDRFVQERSDANELDRALVERAYALQQELSERFEALRTQASHVIFGGDVARPTTTSPEVVIGEALKEHAVGEGERVELSPEYFLRLEQWEGVAERLSQQLQAVGRTSEAATLMEQAAVIGSTLRRFDMHTAPDHDGIVIDRAAYPHEEQQAVEQAVAFLQREYQRLEAQAAALEPVTIDGEATEMVQAEAVANRATETTTDTADAPVAGVNEDHASAEAVAAPAAWSEQLAVLNTYPYATTTERHVVRSMVENLTRQSAAAKTSTETQTNTIAQLERSLGEEIEHVLEGPSIDQLADRVAGILELAAPLQRREPAAYERMQVVAQAIKQTLAEHAAQGIRLEQIPESVVDELSQQYHELEVLADTHRRKWLTVVGQYLPPAGPHGDRAARILRESLQVAWNRRDYSDTYPFLHEQPDVVHEMLALLEHIPPSGITPETATQLEELALRMQVDQPIKLPGAAAMQTSAEATPEAVTADAETETWTEADIALFERLDHNPFVTPSERQTITRLVTQAQALQEAGEPTAEAVAASARSHVSEALATPDPTYIRERIERLFAITEPLHEYDPEAATTLQSLRDNLERVVAEAGASWEEPQRWEAALLERVRTMYRSIEDTAMAHEASWLRVAGLPVPQPGSSWAEVAAFRSELGRTVHDPERHPELRTHQATIRKLFALIRQYENRGRSLSAETAADLRDLAYELYVDQPLLEWVDDELDTTAPHGSSATISATTGWQPVSVHNRVTQPTTDVSAPANAGAGETSQSSMITSPRSDTGGPMSPPATRTTSEEGRSEPVVAANEQTDDGAELPRGLRQTLNGIEQRLHHQTVGFGYREDFPVGATLQFLRGLTLEELLTENQKPITQLRTELEEKQVRPETFKAWVEQVSDMIQDLGVSFSAHETVDEVFRRWYEHQV